MNEWIFMGSGFVAGIISGLLIGCGVEDMVKKTTMVDIYGVRHIIAGAFAIIGAFVGFLIGAGG